MTDTQTPGSPLFARTALVEAGTEAVTEVGMRWLSNRMDGESGVHVDVDRAWRRFTVRGQWWFQATYAFRADGGDTIVSYRCDNIARSQRWMVRLILLQYRLNGALAGIRSGSMEELLDHLRDELHCRARVQGEGER